MGGERASKVRQRERGEICALCGLILHPPPTKPGERICFWCGPNAPVHRVLLHFMLAEGWTITFLERDCRTNIGRRLTLHDPAQILALARRGGAEVHCDIFQHEFERDIEIGRGDLWLNLTRRQYLALTRGRP